METKKIETYSLYEFCQAIQESILQGWRFDFESNDNFPTAFGSMLVTGMVKAEDKLSTAPELVTEAVIEPKRGRKPKE